MSTRGDTKYVKILAEESTTTVVVDARAIGGAPERFPDGLIVRFRVGPDRQLRVEGTDPSGWLGFVPPRRTRNPYAKTTHPLLGLWTRIARPGLLPQGKYVTPFILAKLANDTRGMNRLLHQAWLINDSITHRNLSGLWNAVWRRLQPLLDQEALMLARECTPGDVWRGYNRLVANPEDRALATASRVLAALKFSETPLRHDRLLVTPDIPASAHALGLYSLAMPAWLQARRILPIYGGVRSWGLWALRRLDELFQRYAVQPEAISKVRTPLEWRTFALVVEDAPQRLPEYLADPRGFVTTLLKDAPNKRQHTIRGALRA